MKSLDHTANQYLAFAAIIVAGLEGINKKMLLPKPYNNDPSQLSDSERSLHGIELLPLSFEDRKKAMYSEDGRPFVEFFGEDLINNIFAFQEIDC